MHKYAMIAILGAVVAVGCAARSPIAPDMAGDGVRPVQEARAIYGERYRLWGEWIWCIPETHDRVDVIPRRDSRVHLNVLKWLEEDCGNCLEITNIENNGDSTIDLTVRIRHPKPGHPEFTGFDVKGIIMFNGSYEMPSLEEVKEYNPFYPEPWRISWREVGDPEVLNADGYTVRWCPAYNPGGSNPLLKYWPGKYSKGIPTGNLNAYLNFYSDEQRHMFTCNSVVTRTYHIYLPPGPLVAGYAVEACWAPPKNTPVTDPASDFPISANQEEPYLFKFILNNGEPVTETCCCCEGWSECTHVRVEAKQWGGVKVNYMRYWRPEPYPDSGAHMGFNPCQEPEYAGFYKAGNYYVTWAGGPGASHGYPDGNYRGRAVGYRLFYNPDMTQGKDQVVYTLIDFTIDRE